MDAAVLERDLKNFISKHEQKYSEAESRLLHLEQRATAPGGSPLGGGTKSIGRQLVESDGFRAFQKGAKSSGQITIGSLQKDLSIINAPGLDQPLVPMYRVPGIVMPGLIRLTVRDLMPSIPITSNMVAYAKETLFTNAAAPQAGENVLKAESTLTFTLQNMPVQTLAHWIAASRQIVDDAPALEAYINTRLIYGLKFAEEQQLLLGNGVGNNLSGLIANSTPFDTTQTVASPPDSFIDTLGRAIEQVYTNSNFPADAIVLNHLDFSELTLIKNTLGNYIYSNPQDGSPAQLWGLPVVATKSMPRGEFLVGAFRMAATIWDRADATVELSREHADFLIRNMVAILCESRLALTVFRNLALVSGFFPFGS